MAPTANPDWAVVFVDFHPTIQPPATTPRGQHQIPPSPSRKKQKKSQSNAPPPRRCRPPHTHPSLSSHLLSDIALELVRRCVCWHFNPVPDPLVPAAPAISILLCPPASSIAASTRGQCDQKKRIWENEIILHAPGYRLRYPPCLVPNPRPRGQ